MRTTLTGLLLALAALSVAACKNESPPVPKTVAPVEVKKEEVKPMPPAAPTAAPAEGVKK
jgi:hypothetical protein